ncbi:hypothetical protein Tco_0303152 [Tanacetum coccineum]
MMGHWYPPIPNLTNILQNDTGGMIEDVKKDRIIDGYGSSDQPLVTLEVSWESNDRDKTPSPAPGVDESPFMTSGEIEGTPSRLEYEDTPIDIGVLTGYVASSVDRISSFKGSTGLAASKIQPDSQLKGSTGFADFLSQPNS